MKNVLFLSASVLSLAIATSAFADSNTVYLDQTDAGQIANITQNGSGNNVGWNGNSFVQQNGAGSGGNNLSITQGGSGNWVSRDNAGFQSGTGNTAAITQAGVNSDVELQQTGTGNGAYATYPWTNDPGNYDVVWQDSTANASKIELYQNGDHNVFSLGQGAYSNHTLVSQSGNNGYAYVRQGVAGGNDLATGNPLPIGGNYNSAAIYQTTASLNYAVAVQGAGDGNNLTISQNGDWLGANIWQAGYGNIASSGQTGYQNVIGQSNVVLTSATDTPFVQAGNGNNLQNTQGGSYNMVNGYQTGNGNFIYNNQYGTQATATLNQLGNSNQVWNYQAGPSATITTQQTGDSNYIYSSQGGYALAGVTQTGYGNVSTGTQFGGASGSPNTATITQTGNFNLASYAQNGSGNVATITQH